MPLNLRQPGGSKEFKSPYGGGVTTYTVTDQDFGKIITTRSATTAVVLKLPAAGANEGERVEVLLIANQSCRIDARNASEIVTYNDATASSVTVGHIAAKRIGARALCLCDGTSWIVQAVIDPTSTTVPTVA